MLSVKSKVSERRIEPSARLLLIEKLQERDLTPLIRSMRLAGFEHALEDAERVSEMERILAEMTDAEEGAQQDGPYVRGDIFFFETHAFFLIFGDAETAEGMRAGLIHTTEIDAPERKLDAFCRNIDTAADAIERSRPLAEGKTRSFEWHAREQSAPESFMRFASSAQDEGALTSESATKGGDTAERLRAVESLEDADARKLLRRLSDAQAEGRTAEMLLGTGRDTDSLNDTVVARLAATGLVRRELLISCRKDGRSLFRLPSADALAVMTASNAVCSECGAAVADERAEELVTPTALASAMLKDGAWLMSRMRSVLNDLGVNANDIIARPATGEADALLLASVGGEPFLFVLRDGDFTLMHARRAIDAEVDTEVSHLVVISTGKIQEDARTRLREHQKRRTRTLGELELIIVEGVDAAAFELRQAVERVTQKSLSTELYELNASLGMSAGHFVAARFRLLQKPLALQDLAASAAGAITGSLREI